MPSKQVNEPSLVGSIAFSLSLGILCLVIAVVIKILFLYTSTDLLLNSVVAIPLMSLFYILTFIAEANWREYRREIAGWWDIIGLLIISLVITLLVFNWLAAVITLAISIGATYYLYRAQ